MSNFTFLPPEFCDLAKSATLAERHIMGDPRAACFHARFSLETAVHWLYRHDSTLTTPYDQKLNTLLHEPCFQNMLPEVVFQKARIIQRVGNQAAHASRPIRQIDALQVVRELHHLCYWLVRTYTPDASREGASWQVDRVPKAPSTLEVVPRKQLEALEKQLSLQNEAALKQQQELDKRDHELQDLRKKFATARANSATKHDPHDYTEDETRKFIIDMDLQRAGWNLDQKRDREYEVVGMPNIGGVGYADYVLWGDDGKPLAVIEAKRASKDPAVGQQQAKLYADCLEAMHGQRPVIFYTNGYQTQIWDDQFYPPRGVAGFYKKDELARLILRRTRRRELKVADIKDSIAGRYYQKRAIGSIAEQFTQSRRKALLAMATGAGKTRTAIALVDVLQRAGWAKRILFLADRKSLVKQAVSAFKMHLPDSSPVNLITEKDGEGRVFASTYQTIIGMMDDTAGKAPRFSVGYFDLIIIDEAHRSVYQKYGEIFKYFDSLLVGLTATPRNDVDKNTYELFDLEPGVPTDAYELEKAVADNFLVPPRVQQVDMKFPRDGIVYEELSPEEQEQYETLDWGEGEQTSFFPEKVNATAISNWLFNRNTVDQVLQHLMEHGHKVEGGDRLAKTIIFARNHDHAVFIEKRFNHHYPQYSGTFARIIDHYATYALSLIDEFSIKEKMPQIAISVDMLDTGIDVPEVANLVFFKPVFSKIKFWQMIGRGTRLCPDLYGPGMDKADFRVFDFCFNFDYFSENPEGIKSSVGLPLSARLFRARVQLLGHVQKTPDLDPGASLSKSLITGLHGKVKAMNPDNFIVRMHLEAVDRFQQRDAWICLSQTDLEDVQNELAGLSDQTEDEELETRLFDFIILSMQLAHAEGDAKTLDRYRRRVMELAELLEKKAAIPAVKAKLKYLAALQEDSFWDGIDLKGLEDVRLTLRDLVPLLDKKKRHIIYTDFKDEIVGFHDLNPVFIPTMTSAQYEKKVKDYLRSHLDHIVIHRLRTNQPLTETDLQGLETTLTEIGEESGSTLLSGLLDRTLAPSLAYFVRGLVGLDRVATRAAFSEFLSDRSLTSPQMRFVEMVIDQLTARGIMDASALYEAPFSNLHDGGPETLFTGKRDVIDGIFETLKTVGSTLPTLAS